MFNSIIIDFSFYNYFCAYHSFTCYSLECRSHTVSNHKLDTRVTNYWDCQFFSKWDLLLCRHPFIRVELFGMMKVKTSLIPSPLILLVGVKQFKSQVCGSALCEICMSAPYFSAVMLAMHLGFPRNMQSAVIAKLFGLWKVSSFYTISVVLEFFIPKNVGYILEVYLFMGTNNEI